MRTRFAALRRAAVMDNVSIPDPPLVASWRKHGLDLRWLAWFVAGYGTGFSCGVAVSIAPRLPSLPVLLTLITLATIGCFFWSAVAVPIEGGSTRA